MDCSHRSGLASRDLVLVTGASGFIAKTVIRAALALGYNVRGTLRSPGGEEAVRSAVGEPGTRLTLVRVNLHSDQGWAEAIDGCRYVLHLAPPFRFVAPNDRLALVPVAA